MKIVCLIENTLANNACIAEHGLSFYIKTKKHKLLSDLGPSENTLVNAEKLNVNLKEVDTVILSHGHYDHSGGIMPFTKINDKAKIYMQKGADKDYYANDPDAYRYIGIDKEIASLKQTVVLDGDYEIDDEIKMFTVTDKPYKMPSGNKYLLLRDGDKYKQDDFSHEQFLVISCEGKHILISGCAHTGVLNILETYKQKYDCLPDALISGFHLMKNSDFHDNEIAEIKKLAEELDKYDIKYYTCHCTGVPAYEIMKDVLGEKLEYVHCGDEIEL